MPNALLTQINYDDILNEMNDGRFRGFVTFRKHAQINVFLHSILPKSNKLRYNRASGRIVHESGAELHCVVCNTREDTYRLAGIQVDKAWIMYGNASEANDFIRSRIRSTWHKNPTWSTFSEL